MPTQILIIFTALLGAIFARFLGQLARAVILGVAGPFRALVAYGHAVGSVLPR